MTIDPTKSLLFTAIEAVKDNEKPFFGVISETSHYRVCEVTTPDERIYQVQLKVTLDKYDFIDTGEERLYNYNSAKEANAKLPEVSLATAVAGMRYLQQEYFQTVAKAKRTKNPDLFAQAKDVLARSKEAEKLVDSLVLGVLSQGKEVSNGQ